MMKKEKDLIDNNGQLSQLVLKTLKYIVMSSTWVENWIASEIYHGLGPHWKLLHSHMLAEELILLEGKHSDTQCPKSQSTL